MAPGHRLGDPGRGLVQCDVQRIGHRGPGVAGPINVQRPEFHSRCAGVVPVDRLLHASAGQVGLPGSPPQCPDGSRGSIDPGYDPRQRFFLARLPGGRRGNSGSAAGKGLRTGSGRWDHAVANNARQPRVSASVLSL